MQIRVATLRVGGFEPIVKGWILEGVDGDGGVRNHFFRIIFLGESKVVVRREDVWNGDVIFGEAIQLRYWMLGVARGR